MDGGCLDARHEKEKETTSTNNALGSGSYATHESVVLLLWLFFFRQAVGRNVDRIRAKVRDMDTRRVAGRNSGAAV